GKKEKFYLHTSPEFALKKLLASGYEKIFCVTKCFRNFEQFGGNHNTEFTMIEWYRAPGSYQEIMDDTENLFKRIGKKLKIKRLRNLRAVCHSESPEVGEESLSNSPDRQRSLAVALDDRINGAEINCAWDRFSMKEIWQKYVGADLDGYLDSEKMRSLAESRGYAVAENEEYENIFYKIFLNEIEPKLGLERPVFIYDYPAIMASLSKLCDDSRYAERFELYVGGLEIANAFGELTDAEEQRNRLEDDRKKREKLGKETWPVDPDFISALKSGIGNGSAGGIALGVDRMVLLFTGAKDLNEVIFQSVADQLGY
ncbi:MAG: amino acid--tRNA ligase-related protein, partial [Patescibacteria group bacterium]